MDNDQQENSGLVDNVKEAAGTAAKMATKKASAALGKYILTALAPILPYAALVILVVIVFGAVYLGVEHQTDQILTGAQDLGEKLGNGLSLYGFQTNEKSALLEEKRFYKAAEFYKEFFTLSEYEIALVERTLLYEGNGEERIYFTDYGSEEDRSLVDPNDGNGGFFNVLNGVLGFVRQFNITFTQGFTNSFLGRSKFRKGMKLMPEPIAAVLTCKRLTDQGGGEEKFSACYKGYLVAEYDTYLDSLVSQGELDYEIEEGFLVLGKNVVLRTLIGFGTLIEDIVDKIESSLISVIEKWIQDTYFDSIFSRFTSTLFFEFYKASKSTRESIMRIIKITLFGTLAKSDKETGSYNSNVYDSETNEITVNQVTVTDEFNHYYYDGYIVNHLREYYKLDYDEKYDDGIRSTYENKKDIETLQKEIELREQIADDIINTVAAYYALQYGYTFGIKKGNVIPNPGGGFVSGASCSTISEEDLAYFGAPTSGCSLNSCFGVYGGGWGCSAHKGVDINASNGIYSICDGTVSRAGMYNDGSASAVEVKCIINGTTYVVRYLHMPMEYVNRWHEGDHVSVGTYIGEQGAVGNGVSGPHLHLDISANGVYYNPETLVSSCNFNVDCEAARETCENSGQFYCSK